MKKLLFLLTTILILAVSLVAQAAEEESSLTFYQRRQAAQEQLLQQQKQATLPRVAVLYCNNAQTTYDKRIDHFVELNLKEAISSEYYQYIEGTPYMYALQKSGIDDVASAERADLIDILGDFDLDYLVYMEIEPVATKAKATVFSKGKSAVVTAPLKIIDMRNNRTLYNGKITEVGKTTVMMGKIGNKSVTLEGVKKVNEQVKQIIAERLPK